MNLDLEGLKPIYIQIAEWLENEILNERFQEDEKVFSQYKLAELFNINPATAAKGLNMLSEDQILYTKRGLGKFVAEHAKQRILEKRKTETLSQLVHELVLEAAQLQVSKKELIQMIEREHETLKGEGQ